MTIFTNRRMVNLVLLLFLGLFLAGVGFMNSDFVVDLFSSQPAAETPGEPGGVDPTGDAQDPGQSLQNEAGTPGAGGVETFSPADLLKGNANDGAEADFFVEYRMERDRVRSKQVELLQGIVRDPDSDEEMRQEAQTRLIRISEDMEMELQLESLVKAKGYEEAVLFIQPDSVTVILKKEALTEEDAARVADLVSRTTGFGLEKIVIIPK